MINDALRSLRKFHDYKSVELAQMLGISQSYLSEIENGKKSPSIELINKYSDIFGIKPSTILFFSEEIDRDDVKSKVKQSTKSYMMKLIKILEKFGDS